MDVDTLLLCNGPVKPKASCSKSHVRSGAWLLERAGFPSAMGFGFVTGGRMENFAALAAMRISVCNWRTTDEDVERSIEAILRAASKHAR